MSAHPVQFFLDPLPIISRDHYAADTRPNPHFMQGLDCRERIHDSVQIYGNVALAAFVMVNNPNHSCHRYLFHILGCFAAALISPTIAAAAAFGSAAPVIGRPTTRCVAPVPIAINGVTARA